MCSVDDTVLSRGETQRFLETVVDQIIDLSQRGNQTASDHISISV